MLMDKFLNPLNCNNKVALIILIPVEWCGACYCILFSFHFLKDNCSHFLEFNNRKLHYYLIFFTINWFVVVTIML